MKNTKDDRVVIDQQNQISVFLDPTNNSIWIVEEIDNEDLTAVRIQRPEDARTLANRILELALEAIEK